jgi:hypothetical protein
VNPGDQLYQVDGNGEIIAEVTVAESDHQHGSIVRCTDDVSGLTLFIGRSRLSRRI